MDSQNLNTLFTGQLMVTLRETDSTNLYLKQWITNNKPTEGAVILAEIQTAGRGQEGTQWLSQPRENLTLSIYYKPTFLLARQQFLLSMAVALGIRQTVSTLLPMEKALIKWPNDIYLNGSKVCGILIENTLQGQYISGSIIGIGLNVLQTSFPGLPTAASLATFGYQGTLQLVLQTLLNQVEQQYLRLRSGQYESLRQEYLSHLLGKDEKLSFSDSAGSFSGIIRNVDDTGRIHIEADGIMRHYYHKEVSMLMH